MKSLLFPLFCILASFFVLLTDPTFTYILLDNKEAVQPTQQLIQTFAGINTIPENFNTEEKSHLEDVTLLIRIAFFLLAVISIILFRNKQWMKITSKGTIILLIILALATIIPFDSLFTTFHQILFPQGNWTFPVDSTIISFYPKEFFQNYSIAIAIHAIVIALTLTYLQIVSRKGLKEFYTK